MEQKAWSPAYFESCPVVVCKKISAMALFKANESILETHTL
jgi:hypothetical protein